MPCYFRFQIRVPHRKLVRIGCFLQWNRNTDFGLTLAAKPVQSPKPCHMRVTLSQRKEPILYEFICLWCDPWSAPPQHVRECSDVHWTSYSLDAICTYIRVQQNRLVSSKLTGPVGFSKFRMKVRYLLTIINASRVWLCVERIVVVYIPELVLLFLEGMLSWWRLSYSWNKSCSWMSPISAVLTGLSVVIERRRVGPVCPQLCLLMTMLAVITRAIRLTDFAL